MENEKYNKHQKFIIIADDFTGANDCGVQLKKYGLSIITLLDIKNIYQTYEYDVVVLDTETRSLSKDESYNALLNMGKIVNKNHQKAIIYKKIDSTLRGNILHEIKALDLTLQPDIIVFAPAYPKQNRTTIDGIQLIKDIPINETEFLKDPKNPIKTADIKELLNSEPDMNFKHIDIKTIRDLKSTLPLDLNQTRFYSFDAITEKDLDIIVKKIISYNKTVLWVGSAGLMDSLISEISPPNNYYRPVLAVIGSINSLSYSQVKTAMCDKNIFVISVDIEQAVKNPDFERERLLKETISKIDEGYDILVGSAIHKNQISVSKELCLSNGYELSEVSTIIACFIGEFVYEILKTRQVSGLFVTGGDTAVNIINKLSAKGSIIIKEIERGIPYMRITGGPFEGLKVITKAGAFGTKTSIINSIKYIRNDKN